MMHLAQSLWAQWTAVEEHKVLVIGCDNAGKTTLLERWKGRFTDARPLPLTSITPTVGLNIARADVGGRRLLLWDMGGHPSLRSLWGSYYAQCHAVIFVVDATDPARFPEAAALLRQLFLMPALLHTPLLILANKSDCPSAVSSTVLLDDLRLMEVALVSRNYARIPVPLPPGVKRDPTAEAAMASLLDVHPPMEPAGTSGIGGRAYRCMATSGLTGLGVEECLEWLAAFLANNARSVEEL